MVVLATVLMLCAACSAAPAKVEDTVWEYKDLESITLAVTDEELEDLMWSFGVDEGLKDNAATELVKAMKADSYFSTTFTNMWFVLKEDGTAEFSRNGVTETYSWAFEDEANKTGYIAASKEALEDENSRMTFTASKDGKEMRIEVKEAYDGDYQYTAVYVLQPEN